MTEPSSTPRRGRRSPWRAIVIALAVVVGVALVAWGLFNRTDAVEPAPMPSRTATPSVTATVTPTPAPVEPTTPVSTAPPADPRLEGCQPVGEGFVPTGFQMERPVADEPVLSLGLDSDGAIAAPPKNQARTASWWNQGPRPGSDRGKVVLSIHTYRNGGALGNEMYDGESQLQPGDLISLTDEAGNKACYEFVEATKVWVEDYDPNSDVMVDYDGDPMLAIVICWDFNRGTEDWDSRIFFYATPVSA